MSVQPSPVRRSCRLALVAALAAAAPPAPAAQDAPEAIVHSEAGGRALALFPGPVVAEAGARPTVLLLGAPVDAPDARIAESVRACADALRAAGLAAVVSEWRREAAARDVASALRCLRERAAALALDPGRLGVHGVGEGVQAALDAVMEEPRAGSVLSVAAGAGVVIETLRDVPLLLLLGRDDPPRVAAGLRELAFQAGLCGIPATLVEADGAAARACIARFHADRLSPEEPDAAAEDDPERALDRARIAAARGDVVATLRWLERADDLGALDLETAVHDGALVPVRTSAAFHDWLARRAPAAPISLCSPLEPGVRIAIRGRVVRGAARRPASGALLHLWQTDASGLYTHGEGGDAAARLFAWVRTDADGRFEVRTIRPGGYPRTMIPAHLHVAIEHEGTHARPLELLFDDDPRLVDSARRRAADWGWPIVALREEAGQLVGEAMIELR